LRVSLSLSLGAVLALSPSGALASGMSAPSPREHSQQLLAEGDAAFDRGALEPLSRERQGYSSTEKRGIGRIPGLGSNLAAVTIFFAHSPGPVRGVMSGLTSVPAEEITPSILTVVSPLALHLARIFALSTLTTS
jgi:hypothetical protein